MHRCLLGCTCSLGTCLVVTRAQTKLCTPLLSCAPSPGAACSYCDHINAAAKQTIEKLHLMEGLQQTA